MPKGNYDRRPAIERRTREGLSIEEAKEKLNRLRENCKLNLRLAKERGDMMGVERLEQRIMQIDRKLKQLEAQ